MKIELLVAFEVFIYLVKRELSHYSLLLLFLIILSLSAIFADLAGKDLRSSLGLSRGNPVSIVTSIIVHRDFQHLVKCLRELVEYSILLTTLFMLTRVFLKKTDRVWVDQSLSFISIVLLTHITVSADIYVRNSLQAPLEHLGLSFSILGLMGLVFSNTVVFSLLVVLSSIRLKIGVKVTTMKLALLSILVEALVIVSYFGGIEQLIASLFLESERRILIAFLSGVIYGTLFLSKTYSNAEVTLDNIREWRKCLKVDEIREKVIIKLSRAV
ncbi:MAG: hypothetical protein DRJ63_08090 [Thermoprotei archaeon]|nr:MAG: hypothetical protein DRJ63_08090 [Thermoprotei archaeon]